MKQDGVSKRGARRKGEDSSSVGAEFEERFPFAIKRGKEEVSVSERGNGNGSI